MKLDKLNPLKNKVGEEGYEIRLYPGEEGPGKIHVGVQVKDASVPAEYKVFFVPAATYAEFEIYPAKGWESSNAEMDRWLDENSTTYQQAQLDVMKYAIEVYDKRYKGDKDPESVVGFLQPIVPALPENNMPNMIAGQIREMGRNIEKFAEAVMSKKVMRGSEEAAAEPDPVKRATWAKEAIDQLDLLIDNKTHKKIMSACGYKCHAVNNSFTEEAKKRRQFYATEEEFLKMELNPPPGTGSRFERVGNIIYNYYTPRQTGKGIRCYCYLIGGLPEGVNASPTYCQCSRAFIEKYWEGALGRPVKVELGETAITGSDECKFIIHL
jgi:predicted transcriptional regulator YdeE